MTVEGGTGTDSDEGPYVEVEDDSALRELVIDHWGFVTMAGEAVAAFLVAAAGLGRCPRRW